MVEQVANSANVGSLSISNSPGSLPGDQCSRVLSITRQALHRCIHQSRQRLRLADPDASHLLQALA
jgi:hypothetical protein